MVDIVSELRDTRRLGQVLDALRGQFTTRERVMMMLGRFMFSVASAAPQQVRRTARYEWPAQSLVGRRPILQSTGRGEEGIELNGRIYPQFRGGLRQVQAMRELAGLGDADLLLDGLGFVYGLFAITEVEETSVVFDATSAPRRIDFRMRLAHAGDANDGGP